MLYEHLRAGPSTQKTLKALSAGIRGQDTVWEMEGGLGGAWTLWGAIFPGLGHPPLPSTPQASGGGREPTMGLNWVSPPEAPSLQLAPAPLIPHWEEAQTQRLIPRASQHTQAWRSAWQILDFINLI